LHQHVEAMLQKETTVCGCVVVVELVVDEVKVIICCLVAPSLVCDANVTLNLIYQMAKEVAKCNKYEKVYAPTTCMH